MSFSAESLQSTSIYENGFRLPKKGDLFQSPDPLAKTYLMSFIEKYPISPSTLHTTFSPDLELVCPIGDANRAEIVSILLNLPPSQAQRIWMLGENTKYITDNEATHRALERIYSGPLPESTPEGYAISRFFLENLNNARGTRNRFRIVKSKAGEAIERKLIQPDAHMNILSIAAGSSRAILEKVSSLDNERKKRISIRLVDISDKAIEDGKQLAGDLGILDQVDFKKTNFLRLDQYLEEGYNPDFIEAVGLFDYLPNKVINKVLIKAYQRLYNGGTLTYSNVSPNDEQDLLGRMIQWREMYYRNANELIDLAQKAGLAEENIQLIQEPLGTCNIVVAKK